MEELRNHSPNPTQHERAWMSADPVAALVRLVALAGIAIAIGVSATYLTAPQAPTVASIQR
jgi:hypothetical protein